MRITYEDLEQALKMENYDFISLINKYLSTKQKTEIVKNIKDDYRKWQRKVIEVEKDLQETKKRLLQNFDDFENSDDYIGFDDDKQMIEILSNIDFSEFDNELEN